MTKKVVDKWSYDQLAADKGLLTKHEGIKEVTDGAEVPDGYKQIFLCEHKDKIYGLFSRGIGRFYHVKQKEKSKGYKYFHVGDVQRVIDWAIERERAQLEAAAGRKPLPEQDELPMDDPAIFKPMKSPSLINAYGVIRDAIKMPAKLEAYRIKDGPLAGTAAYGFNGAFQIPFRGRILGVIASDSEQWAAIKGYEGLYLVSTLGRVMAKSKTVQIPNGAQRHHKRTELSQEVMAKGYKRVTLCRDGDREKVLTHILVAQTFIDNPLGLPQVNHIDGDKGNCHVENLEFCSQEYNQHHAIENGLHYGCTVEEIEKIKDRLDQGETCAQIAADMNCSRQKISYYANGRHRSISPAETCRWNGLPHWDHVSVSMPGRCPTWNEMCYIKDFFFDDEETVIQYHPPKSQYINDHDFVLHLWRKHGEPYELPPAAMV